MCQLVLQFVLIIIPLTWVAKIQLITVSVPDVSSLTYSSAHETVIILKMALLIKTNRHKHNVASANCHVTRIITAHSMHYSDILRESFQKVKNSPKTAGWRERFAGRKNGQLLRETNSTPSNIQGCGQNRGPLVHHVYKLHVTSNHTVRCRRNVLKPNSSINNWRSRMRTAIRPYYVCYVAIFFEHVGNAAASFRLQPVVR